MKKKNKIVQGPRVGMKEAPITFTIKEKDIMKVVKELNNSLPVNERQIIKEIFNSPDYHLE